MMALAKPRRVPGARLWGAFGLMLGLFMVSGVAIFSYVREVHSLLVHVVDVEEPLKESVLEMEIHAGKAAQAILDHVRDGSRRSLEAYRTEATRVRTLAEQVARLATTDPERELVARVTAKLPMFTDRARDILELVDAQTKQVRLVQEKATTVSQRLDALSALHADQEILPRMEVLVFRLVSAVERHVIQASPEDKEWLSSAPETFADLSRRLPSRHTSTEVEGLTLAFAELTRAAQELTGASDQLRTRVRAFEAELEDIDAILDNDLKSLVGQSTLTAATVARELAHKTVLVLLSLTGAAAVVGGFGAWMVSREVRMHRRRADDLAVAKAWAEKATETKSKFLAAASHDLRQPMHAIGLLLGALERHSLDSGAREIVETVTRTHASLERLLNALLNISKLDAGSMTPEVSSFRLAPVLEELRWAFAGPAAEKCLVLGIVPSSAVVRSDPEFLKRILRNLVANALQYTLEGRILVGCRRRPGSIRIEVWDTGIGIPDDQIDRIFEEFHQAKDSRVEHDGGLGLGLAIVDRLARLLGHQVAVRSWPGRGSVFSVEVPLSTERLAVTSSSTIPTVGKAFVGERVFLVEDDPVISSATEQLLSDWGLDVRAGRNADDLLSAPSPGEPAPILVIADYHIGDGITGIDAIMAIRKVHGESIPGIIVTGDTRSEPMDAAKAAGFLLLHKPLRPARLRATMANVLRSRQPSPRRTADRKGSAVAEQP